MIKQIKKKIRVGFFVLFILMAIQPQIIQGNNYSIKEIGHNPNKIPSGSNITIFIEFEIVTDIKMVRLFFCQLSPDFICEPSPIVMKLLGNKFEGNFLVSYEEGTLLGYHFIITYTNDSYIEIPSSSNFLDLDNIVEPIPGSFYLQIEVIAPETSTNPTFLVVYIIAIFVITYFSKKRRKN